MQNTSRRIEAVLLTCLVAGGCTLGLRAWAQAPGFAPNDACVGNARILAQAITQYAQNYDERLPPTQTPQTFQNALLPYVHDPAAFLCPADGKPFLPNPAISGKTFPEVGAPETVETFRDSPPDGSPATIAYLDQHIERGGVEQGDPNKIVYAHARVLSFGVTAYVQDNAGRFPPMQTPAEFQAAVYPYTQSHRVFYAPNGAPFVPNAALSGVLQISLPNPAHTVVFRDQPPYPGGIPTIAYADGSVRHGQIGKPSDRNNIGRIGLAVLQYTQDNPNNDLPPTNNYGAFEAALKPYLPDAGVFVSPDTGLPYTLDAAVSGQPLSSFPDPSQTELLRDAQRSRDGVLNIGYLDGHVVTQNYFVPKQLAVGPDDVTHLLWPQQNSQAALWTLSPAGDTLTENAYPLDENGKAIAFSVGPDDQTRLVARRNFGAITLDTFAPDAGVESALRYGPYDGWAPLLITTGAGDQSRLLWRRYDASLALWKISPTGDYQGAVFLRPVLDKTPVGLGRGADGRTRLLWKPLKGGAVLWTFSATDGFQGSVGFQAHTGFAVTALGLGLDNKPRLLWDNGAGQAEVWTLTPDGQFVNVVTFALAPGWMASQLTVGQAGDLRVLWTSADGSGRLQTLSADGKVQSVRDLMPYL